MCFCNQQKQHSFCKKNKEPATGIHVKYTCWYAKFRLQASYFLTLKKHLLNHYLLSQIICFYNIKTLRHSDSLSRFHCIHGL